MAAGSHVWRNEWRFCEPLPQVHKLSQNNNLRTCQSIAYEPAYKRNQEIAIEHSGIAWKNHSPDWQRVCFFCHPPDFSLFSYLLRLVVSGPMEGNWVNDLSFWFLFFLSYFVDCRADVLIPCRSWLRSIFCSLGVYSLCGKRGKVRCRPYGPKEKSNWQKVQ